jgi:cytochrome c-type biogenesis protein CcmH/NrfG
LPLNRTSSARWWNGFSGRWDKIDIENSLQMKVESILFAIGGMLFGVIVGWIIGAQQPGRPAARTETAQPAPVQQPVAQGQTPPALDEGRVQALQTIVTSDPKNAEARIQLANTYFDAERYQDAIKWYEEALTLDPKNVNASTDLGVSYYYSNQPDRALKQFDHSLAIDPKHTKTLLNQGIVRAFGKQDLDGATASWRKVVEIAPDSQEGQAAKRALDSMKSAHPGGTGPP